MSVDTKKALRELDTYGYTIVKNYLAEDKVKFLKDKVHGAFNKQKETKYAGVPDRDDKDKIIYNLQNKDLDFLRLLDEPQLDSILRTKLNDPFYRFLPSEESNYILNYFNARSSGEALDLHIDSLVPALTPHIWAMQAVYVLDEFREDNGATVVAPGSHKSGTFTNRELQKDELKLLLAKPGDLVMWDSRIWHGTLANTSGADRWAIVATFSSWWVKQSMDMTRSFPAEFYEQANERQKRLIGFLSIPPKDEFDRINTKQGYGDLKKSLSEYKL
jgi:ectoine hydroxylase-related dioxygenase (phytanoyl-CoA dioxygenase family)